MTLENFKTNISASFTRNELQLLYRDIKAYIEEKKLSPEFWFEAIEKLNAAMPFQYIVEKAYFYNLTLAVSPKVLIPRPETEELVEWALDKVLSSQKPLRILDIGTGSGCIAIALAHHAPNHSYTAVDIDAEALKIAEKNAILNKTQIDFKVWDVFSPPIWPDNSFDLIISNPPYISESEVLAPSVYDYEPHIALFVPQEDVLKYYHRILDLGVSLLTEKGSILFETSQYQFIETYKDFQITLKKDYSGHQRFALCTLIS
ncbi:MAG: peptide chain release factor N(5)-glutamine methyltransferase [Chitinophagales bacterium]|jgi:release factor glutamine methyltransferase|nr:peptide chain release factor N(5)-glutamine methyltransferase [Chitinophagales bacterium]